MSGAITNGISDGSIYLGVWINWSHGYTKGATLTLTHRDGGLLTAFLALFVTVAGTGFWRLFCLGSHYILSSNSGPQDGLYHQQQAVLRNAATAVDGFHYFLKLAWSWRGRAQTPWMRISPLLGGTIAIMALFSIASIFSSQVSTATGDEVLISSPNCGAFNSTLYNMTLDPGLEDLQLLQGFSTRLSVASASYAQQCYDNNATAQECSIFTQKELTPVVSRNSSCPFPGEGRICLRNSTNLRMDSGMLNSHDHLGVNAAPKDRFAFRRIVECAPLVTDNYTQVLNRSTVSSEDPWIRYYYGERPSTPGNDSEFSYEYPVNLVASSSGNDDYTIGMQQWRGEDAITSTYLPIADLRRQDANTMLVFLSANAINFLEPVDDDLFSAHQPVSTVSSAPGVLENITAYYRDEPAGVLGCTAQYQICNPARNNCTGLSTYVGAVSEASSLFDTDEQRAAFDAWQTSYYHYVNGLAFTIELLGIGSLTARDTLSDGTQIGLPADQWQLEVQNWHASSMAKMQRLMVEMATGPSETGVKKYWPGPTGAAGKQVCQNQKVRSTAYTSFSVLGLSLTLAIGGLIIVLSQTIERLLESIQRHYKRGVYRRLEWASNETLQLQRMAHEELGIGTWTRTAKCPPVTVSGEMLGVLEISDEKHPVLTSSPSSSNSLSIPEVEKKHDSPLEGDSSAALMSRAPSDAQVDTIYGHEFGRKYTTDDSHNSLWSNSTQSPATQYPALLFSPLGEATSESNAQNDHDVQCSTLALTGHDQSCGNQPNFSIAGDVPSESSTGIGRSLPSPGGPGHSKRFGDSANPSTSEDSGATIWR